ncbi:MAG TPA: type II secretion system F family protein [bacterium]|nr:type II secretion system F family protein [bacterium]
MPTFEYAGRDVRGGLVRGRVEADDDLQARAQLRRDGYFVTALRESAWGRRQGTGVRNRAEVAMFTHDLAMLLEAGLPLLQAVEVMGEHSGDKRMQDVLRQLTADIREGKKFSAALARHPDLFSPMYVGLVSNGEMGGRMGIALERLAGFLERDLIFRQKVRDSLIYPGLVLAMAAVVLTVFIVYIIPAFDRVYRHAGSSLPPLTRALLAWSSLVRGSLPVLVPAAVVVLAVPPVRQAVWVALAAPLQRLVLRVPHAGRLAHTALLGRFAHAMAMMLASGVPLLSALDVAGEAVGAGEFRPVLKTLRETVVEGQRLTTAMRKTQWFTPMFIRMTSIGEETGQLDVMMTRAATVLDREFDVRMRRFLALLEPALTLVVGAVVGVILLALYLPIFGLGKALMH